MFNFEIEIINLKDKIKVKKITDFLSEFDLDFDDVDYTIAILNKNKIIATCSKKNNLIKCIAVCTEFNNLNLTNKLLTEIIVKINEQYYDEALIITKFENKKIFEGLNFLSLYSNQEICFLTNRSDKYSDYINYLKKFKNRKQNAIIAMNANPFTNGHKYLVENASSENENVFVVVVKEDDSLFTYEERLKLVREGVQHLDNVIVLEGTNYILSKSVFPSYFIKSEDKIIKEQTMLDTKMFIEIFIKNLNVNIRYLGEEPFSKTTKIYNDTIKEIFDEYKINVKIIARNKVDDNFISASRVRMLILENKIDEVKKMVPTSTYKYIYENDLHSRSKNKIKKIYKDN